MSVTDEDAAGEDVRDEAGELLARFAKWDKQIDAHFGSWVKDVENDYDFDAGKQWSEDDLQKLEELERIAVTFNRVSPTIDAVAGAEIMGRQQVIYEPRQVESSGKNEVLSKAAEWIRDRCDAEHEESEAARDCFLCGVGVTDTRISYEEDPKGQIIIERVDPTEVLPNSGARKANYADARYLRRKRAYSQEEFDELFPDETGDDGAQQAYRRPVVVEPRQRYTHGSEQNAGSDDVYVSEYQWYETNTVYWVLIPGATEPSPVDEETFEKVKALAEQHGQVLNYVPHQQRRYRRAFVAHNEILDLQDIETGSFTYSFMTGKRDRNAGTFYGLMRAMKDPARFSNKLFSQMLNIVNSSAKGGLLAEEGSVGDVRAFEASFADLGGITYVPNGSLSGGKIMPKPQAPFPATSEHLMQQSIEAIRDVTGVNQELLGLADRDQAGVLEHQRKQAAYGILSSFFDSIKRYRKINGRKLLRFMQKYITDDTLVRIVGEDGTSQYVAANSEPVMDPKTGKPALDPVTKKPTFKPAERALSDDSIEYDVIVDDSPAGPNQKIQTFQLLMQLMPTLSQADLPADFWAQLVRYSPLPAALSQKLAEALIDAEKAQSENPVAQMQQQLGMAEMQAKVEDTKASAAHKQGQAELATAKAGEIAHKVATAGSTTDDDLKRAKAAQARQEVVTDTLHAMNEMQGPRIE